MRDLLQYATIATAGQPRSLTGDAFMELGALISQLDFKEKKKAIEEDVITDGPTEEYLKDKLLGEYEGDAAASAREEEMINTILKSGDNVEVEDISFIEWEQDLNSILNPPKTKNKAKKEEPKYGPESSPHSFLYQNTPGYGPEAKKYKNIISQVKSGKLSAVFARDYIESRGGKWQGVDANYDSVLNRFTDNTLKVLEKFRYNKEGKDDTPLKRVIHAVQSPFLQTAGIGYTKLREAVIPEYAARLGGAAAQGFNIAIDKFNYDQQVKADYDKELDDEMGSLNVPAEFISDKERKDFLEIGFEKKKALNEAFSKYANGEIDLLEYRNTQVSLKSELQNIAKTKTALANYAKEFNELKGTIDIDASDKEMLDFHNTLQKDPQALYVKSIEGVDYVVGKTRGGKNIQVPVSKIANGTAGFRVVEKTQMAPIASGALKAIDQYREDIRTRFGTGQATASKEKAEQIGINYVKSILRSDENKLRSTMSQLLNVDHASYEQLLENDGNASEQMLTDAATEFYNTYVAPQYFPQTKTTRFASKTSGGASTASERKIAKIKAQFDTFGPLNENTRIMYQNTLPPNLTIKKDDKGFFIGDKKTGDITERLDLNSETAKSQIARYAGVTGYSQPEGIQDLSQYNFEL